MIELNTIVLAVAGFFCVYYVHGIQKSIDTMCKELARLSATMAQVVERSENHDYEIKKLRCEYNTIVQDVAALKTTLENEE